MRDFRERIIYPRPLILPVTQANDFWKLRDKNNVLTLAKEFSMRNVICDFDQGTKLGACLHGGGGPQLGGVTRFGGITRLSILSLILS